MYYYSFLEICLSIFCRFFSSSSGWTCTEEINRIESAWNGPDLYVYVSDVDECSQSETDLHIKHNTEMEHSAQEQRANQIRKLNWMGFFFSFASSWKRMKNVRKLWWRQSNKNEFIIICVHYEERCSRCGSEQTRCAPCKMVVFNVIGCQMYTWNDTATNIEKWLM